MKKIKFIVVIFTLLLSLKLLATASIPSLNQCPDMIFIDGMQNDSVPSAGTGGGFPGDFSRTINTPAGAQTYYYYVPSSYQLNKPMPLLALWHGAVVAGGGPSAAQNTRAFWRAAAEANEFIVVAQAIRSDTGCNSCGWSPVTDSQILVNILNDVQDRYNVETSRIYAWGFSAGGHVMHAIALNSADYFAGYAISGAHLGFARNAGYTPAAATRQLPVYISVGQSDGHFNDAQNDLSDFVNAGWKLNQNLWFDDFVGGHELLSVLPEKAWQHICIASNLD